MEKMYKDDLRDILEELPCPEVILSVDCKGKKDLMTATAMWLSYDPVIVAIYIRPDRMTHDLVKEAREFAINVCSEEQAPLALDVGTSTGREADKIKQFNIKTAKAQFIRSPLIDGCVANYECKVVNSFEIGNHTCFLGLVVGYRKDNNLKPLNRFRGKTYKLGEALAEVKIEYPH
jgi:flavin reductase (DIM6/NTAB) family NADH-FMN oxidoreductase RutF